VNKIQDLLGKFPARVALLLYISIGLLQMGVIPAGLETWLGIHWMYGVMCAGFLAWIPLVGQAAGFAAAVDALNWPVVAAAALFLWPVWFLTAVLAMRLRRDRDPAEMQEVEEFERRVGRFDRTHRVSPEPETVPANPDDIPPHVRSLRPYRPAA